jgi:2-polyprenyl-3-methyl-5-hydroxy-6-metoxy-1,4-benzoquinol methylase
MLNQKTIEAFRTVVSSLFSEEAQFPKRDALRRYYGRLEARDGTSRYIQHKVDLLRLGGTSPDGAVVLDAGCGYGLTCILFAIMGAKEMHGIDIVEARLDVFKECLANLRDGGIKLQVFPVLGNVMNTGYEANKFDIILSDEAVSHYRDVDMFFREARRILRPGGILMIADGNNGANPKIVRECRQLWERFEKGPAGDFHGHVIEEAYQDMRKAMIREEYPQWSEDQVIAVAKGTFGMTKDEVLEACRRVEGEGTLPDTTFNGVDCPVNPRTGSLMERFEHPQELARRLERLGFTTRVYSYFGGGGGNPVIRSANAILMMLTEFTLRYARAYRIIARKA